MKFKKGNWLKKLRKKPTMNDIKEGFKDMKQEMHKLIPNLDLVEYDPDDWGAPPEE